VNPYYDWKGISKQKKIDIKDKAILIKEKVKMIEENVAR
jgi:hypothetical protein